MGINGRRGEYWTLSIPPDQKYEGNLFHNWRRDFFKVIEKDGKDRKHKGTNQGKGVPGSRKESSAHIRISLLLSLAMMW